MRIGSSLLIALVVIIICIFVTIPLYWAVVVGLSPGRDILFTRSLYPSHITFENVTNLFSGRWGGRVHGYSFILPLRNSLIVALSNTIFSVTISILAAYAIALMQFKGKEIFSIGILFAYLFPPFVIMIALRQIAVWLRLANTLHGLVLFQSVITVPYCTWMLRSYFLSLPKEIEEAAMVDGCTRFQALVRIVVPVSLPGVIAAASFAFTLSWQDYILASILLDSDKLFTVPIALVSMVIGDLVEWGRVMIAAMIGALPNVLVYFLLQRFLVPGLTGGAVKA